MTDPDEAVAKADKDNSPVDFTDAIAKVGELKEVGKGLQIEKHEADNIKEPATPEEQVRLKQLHQRFDAE